MCEFVLIQTLKHSAIYTESGSPLRSRCLRTSWSKFIFTWFENLKFLTRRRGIIYHIIAINVKSTTGTTSFHPISLELLKYLLLLIEHHIRLILHSMTFHNFSIFLCLLFLLIEPILLWVNVALPVLPDLVNLFVKILQNWQVALMKRIITFVCLTHILLHEETLRCVVWVVLVRGNLSRWIETWKLFYRGIRHLWSLIC